MYGTRKLQAVSAFFVFTGWLLAQGQGNGDGNGVAQQVAALTAQVSSLQSTVTTLQSTVSTLQTSLSKLQGNITAADLVGTYVLYGFQNELTPSIPSVGSYVYAGTVTLNADGTASLSVTQSGAYLNFPAAIGSISSADKGLKTTSATWAYSNGTITVNGTNTIAFSVGAGGRVLIHASANPLDNTDVLLIATRL